MSLPWFSFLTMGVFDDDRDRNYETDDYRYSGKYDGCSGRYDGYSGRYDRDLDEYEDDYDFSDEEFLD